MKKYHLSILFVAVVLAFGSFANAESIKKVEAKALAGDAKAQFELAKMYEDGRATGKPDLGSALSWYEEAAHNGLKIASYRIKMLGQP